MRAVNQSDVIGRGRLWAGRIIGALVTLFMLFDAIIHMTRIPAVVQGFAELAFPLGLSIPLSIVEIVCVLFFVFPRTSVFGAILLTGYLGGAVAVQLRVGHPFFSQSLFPVYIAILLWGSLSLRDKRLNELIFLRS
jgi:hypothetical protein